MKIAHTELNLPQGKIKYNDGIFVGLAEKFHPVKVSPYYFEFLPDDYESADVIAIANEYVLDLLFFVPWQLPSLYQGHSVKYVKNNASSIVLPP